MWRLLLSSWSLSYLCDGLLDGGVGLCWLDTLWGGFLGLVMGEFLWKSHDIEDVLISEGDVTFHLLPELHYAPCQKAWLALSRQIGFSTQNWKALA